MPELPFPDEERIELAADAVWSEMKWTPILRDRVLRYLPNRRPLFVRWLAEAACYAAWIRAEQPPKKRSA